MEIEAKYVVPDRATFERLLALRALNGYELREAGIEHVSDHYLDTPSRAVERGGYALRLRQDPAEPRWLATLKGLGGAQGALHTRPEHEAAVPPQALPAAWPDSQARELALRLAGPEPLSEQFVLEQTRYRRQVRHGDRPAAALSLDVVVITVQARDVVSFELEIELLPDGQVEDLRALGDALAEYGLPPQPLSKFARALALLETGTVPAAPAPRLKSPGVRPDDPMAEAGRKVLRFHWQRLLAQEAGVRAGLESKPVHAMRVATRRQRAALRLFGASYKPKTLRRLRQGLQTLARRLGDVRDLDVQLEAARAYQAGLPAAAAAAFQPLLDAWETERQAARAALLAHLDSDAFHEFKRDYGQFVETEGAGVPRPRGGEVAPTLLCQALPAQLWAHYAAVRAYEHALAGAPLETLHALRIEGKRLRYALEFAAEALDPAVNELIEAVTALQEHLGALNDADVASARLRAFEAGLDKGSEHAATRAAVRAYLRARQARLSALRRTVARPWRVLLSGRFRKRLGRVVGRL